jgi:hypothetical protein
MPHGGEMPANRLQREPTAWNSHSAFPVVTMAIDCRARKPATDIFATRSGPPPLACRTSYNGRRRPASSLRRNVNV